MLLLYVGDLLFPLKSINSLSKNAGCFLLDDDRPLIENILKLINQLIIMKNGSRLYADALFPGGCMALQDTLNFL